VSLLAVGVDALAEQRGHQGHRQRDEALLRVACALQATLRKEDQAAVFSGGRVYVLAREADPEGVQALARRIRAAVSRSGFTTGSTAPGITVSVGVATLETVPARGQEALCAGLLEAAWKALCKAQRRGRGKVMVLRLSAPT
jgi:diguanylate cyclase (GGDEF)-like protein